METRLLIEREYDLEKPAERWFKIIAAERTATMKVHPPLLVIALTVLSILGREAPSRTEFYLCYFRPA
jgi:hypothetical protein